MVKFFQQLRIAFTFAVQIEIKGFLLLLSFFLFVSKYLIAAFRLCHDFEKLIDFHFFLRHFQLQDIRNAFIVALDIFSQFLGNSFYPFQIFLFMN